MKFETIRLDVDARGVAQVSLARAEKHNAMNARMIAELSDVARWLAEQQDLRAVVLQAEGRSFCAGGDLGWMKDQAAKDRQGKLDEALTLARMLGLWNALPQPVIGRVQGAAYGGGLGLIAVCDHVVASDAARFALTETRLGLIPATIGPFVAAKLGEAFARQVFFNGAPIEPELLQYAGMIGCIVAPEDLDASVEAEVVRYLECAPGAVAASKALCRALLQSDPASQAEFSAAALADRWEAAEALMGIEAFFARQEPPWRRSVA